MYCFWFYGEHHRPTSCIIDAQFCSVRHKITSQSLIRTVKLSYCLLNVYRISIVLKRESLERANASALNGSSGHLIYSDCGSPEVHRSTAGNHERPQASWTLSVTDAKFYVQIKSNQTYWTKVGRPWQRELRSIQRHLEFDRLVTRQGSLTTAYE